MHPNSLKQLEELLPLCMESHLMCCWYLEDNMFEKACRLVAYAEQLYSLI